MRRKCPRADKTILTNMCNNLIIGQKISENSHRVRYLHISLQVVMMRFAKSHSWCSGKKTEAKHANKAEDETKNLPEHSNSQRRALPLESTMKCRLKAHNFYPALTEPCTIIKQGAFLPLLAL